MGKPILEVTRIVELREMNIPVLVDGPNYVNRVLQLGVDKRFVASQLSGRGLIDFLNHVLSRTTEFRVSGECQTLEFVCSPRNFGPTNAKLTNDEQRGLLSRLGMETGVFVESVIIPGSSEKGVDATIQSKLEEFSLQFEFAVLVSHDRDFIPVLRKLRHRTRIVCVAVGDDFPTELANEAYHTISIGMEMAWLFSYSYPWIPVKTLTMEQCADLFANADDRKFNQVRLSNNGYVFIACDDLSYTGNSVARFEAFSPYNGYVGPKAASSPEYIKQEYADIVAAHKKRLRGYIDYSP